MAYYYMFNGKHVGNDVDWSRRPPPTLEESQIEQSKKTR